MISVEEFSMLRFLLDQRNLLKEKFVKFLGANKSLSCCNFMWGIAYEINVVYTDSICLTFLLNQVRCMQNCMVLLEIH